SAPTPRVRQSVPRAKGNEAARALRQLLPVGMAAAASSGPSYLQKLCEENASLRAQLATASEETFALQRQRLEDERHMGAVEAKHRELQVLSEAAAAAMEAAELFESQSAEAKELADPLARHLRGVAGSVSEIRRRLEADAQ
ncbi:unnamed protein product, partial [Polarella glacialis]